MTIDDKHVLNIKKLEINHQCQPFFLPKGFNEGKKPTKIITVVVYFLNCCAGVWLSPNVRGHSFIPSLSLLSDVKAIAKSTIFHCKIKYSTAPQ